MITGQQIREAREAKGWERSQLARRAKVHHISVRWAEKGKGKPEIIKAIMDALGIIGGIDSNGTGWEVKQSSDIPCHDTINGIPADQWRAGVRKEIEEHNHQVEEVIRNEPDDDLTIPGTLVKVAREESLTIGQTLNLLRVRSVLNDNGGNCNPRTVEEWRAFCGAMKEML